MPGNRTCVTSMNIGNYFRLSPDNRLIFGGRARFSATSDQRSDAKSGAILRAEPRADLPATRQRRDRLLLGRAGRHDQGPLSAGGLRDGVWLRDGLFRPRRAAVHPYGHDHGRCHARARPTAIRWRASNGRPSPAISASPGSCRSSACTTRRSIAFSRTARPRSAGGALPHIPDRIS